MALPYFEGFEAGDTSSLVSVSAATIVQSAIVNTGAYALKQQGPPAITPRTSLVSTSTATIAGSFAVYIPAASLSGLAASEITVITLGTVASPTGVFLIGANWSGTSISIDMNFGGGSAWISGPTVSLDAWHNIRFALDTAAGGVGKVWVDGVLSIDSTHAGLMDAVTSVLPSSPGSTRPFYFDDVYLLPGTIPPSGAIKIIARQAAASQAPTYDTFTKSTGGTIGTVWNDTPFNATTNANKATTGGAQTMNVFSFGSAQTGHGSEVIAAGDTILGAKAAVIEKTSATSSGGTLSSVRYRINGADVDKAITLTAADAYYESAIFTDTIAHLNAMEVGVLKGATTRTHTVEDAWVMVAYIPAATGPVTGTASSSQASQTQADAGKETVKGTATASQTAQAESVAAKEVFKGTATESQGAQSEVAAGTVTAATHITGTATSAQAAQSEALAAKETIRATATEAQAAQAEAAAGKETIRATATESQAAQAETIAAKEKFTGTATESQAAQTEAIAAAEKFVGTETSAQNAQTEAAAGTESLVASAASTQAQQSETIVAVETITATASSAQAQQQETASEREVITGTAIQAQSAQQETAAATETLTGSITAAQAPQTLASTGTLHISGAIAEIQAPQSTIASSAGAVSGTVESVQASQIQVVSGTVVVPVAPTTAGGGWNVPITVHQPAKRPMVIAGYAIQRQAKQAQSALGSFTFVMKNPSDEELLLLLLGGVA